MPQVVDLEALVCGGGCGEGNGKVACETLIDPVGGGSKPGNRSPPLGDPDLPDSFRLPLEDVIDWVSRNAAAAAYDRDGSTRGGANPRSASARHQHTSPRLHAGSQRRYAKPKGPIIGLPGKIQGSGYLGQSARRQHGCNGRLFPRTCGDQSAGGRTAVPAVEPTSPKVSCFGRVLSDQEFQGRRRRAFGTPEVSRESSSVAETSASASAWGTTEFWASVVGLACCAQRREAALLDEGGPASSSGAFSSATDGKTTPSSAVSGETVTLAPTPGLGGMKRLESGRRPASWCGDLELDVDDVGGSGPSPQRRGEGILPGRRSVGSVADLDRDGEWERAGAASV